MKIKRKGSYRNQGPKYVIKDRSPQVKWQYWRQELIIEVKEVRNVDQPSTHHDYEIILNHDDVISLIEVYAENALENNPEELHDALSDHLFLLQKLAMCALGYDVSEVTPLVEE